jgi:hypothetical protein
MYSEEEKKLMAVCIEKGIVYCNIDGSVFVSAAGFARLTNRTPMNVSHLLRIGNKYRRLKCRSLIGSRYIPLSEYTEFPFAHKAGGYYKFTLEGKTVDFADDGIQIGAPIVQA